MKTNLKKTLLTSSIALILGTTGAEAAQVSNFLGAYTWATDSANITMLASNGGNYAMTNDVTMLWDGSAYNSSADYTGPGSVANVTASSTTPFGGQNWAAHDIQMFMPGSYVFDTTLGGGNPETGTLGATVGVGQLGMHMLFDWIGNLNIDVFMVFDQNSVFGSGLLYSTQTTLGGSHKCDQLYSGTITQNCLYDGLGYGSDGAPVLNQMWMLSSTDPDGDGIMGIPMAASGPFAGFSWNFNANLVATPIPPEVPLPGAVWLFGSGLMGLMTVARQKRRV